ncbi:unnamed protein product, partial [Discosporangium mesarthrocarpum]
GTGVGGEIGHVGGGGGGRDEIDTKVQGSKTELGPEEGVGTEGGAGVGATEPQGSGKLGSEKVTEQGEVPLLGLGAEAGAGAGAGAVGGAVLPVTSSTLLTWGSGN